MRHLRVERFDPVERREPSLRIGPAVGGHRAACRRDEVPHVDDAATRGIDPEVDARYARAPRCAWISSVCVFVTRTTRVGDARRPWAPSPSLRWTSPRMFSTARRFTTRVTSVGSMAEKPLFESGWRCVMTTHRTGLPGTVCLTSARRFFASSAVAPVSRRRTPSPMSNQAQFVTPKRPTHELASVCAVSNGGKAPAAGAGRDAGACVWAGAAAARRSAASAAVRGHREESVHEVSCSSVRSSPGAGRRRRSSPLRKSSIWASVSRARAALRRGSRSAPRRRLAAARAGSERSA